MPGPTLPISEETHATKYRHPGESFEQSIYRIADALKDGDDHRRQLRDILMDMRFLPAGRVQCAMGSPRETTAFNCFVSGVIEDSMDSIMTRAMEAAETMRRGGGIGYDFSRLRPRGEHIASLDSRSSGPISFMGIYDSICQTISSAGHRRGAQMAVMRIDHPDIEEFVRCKQNEYKLRGFNVSVGVTDEFMHALLSGEKFALRWPTDGRVFRHIQPEALWNEIMRSTWDWAEPGVLFLNTINKWNNLWYCETIEATNPCGEQPLPPYGACLLGSFNLVKYVRRTLNGFAFNWEQFERDIPVVVRAMDNVIDRTTYPLYAQELEAVGKRRMGLGVTGLANALEAMGDSYGSEGFLLVADTALQTLTEAAYEASVDLAVEKGSFPALDRDLYVSGNFIKELPCPIRDHILRFGIRNSHLTSIAPTGTISLTADNVSSGIEPPFSHSYERTIQTFEGPRVEQVTDYAFREWGVRGQTANELDARTHLNVLATAQKHVDSAVSKTCNVGPGVDFDQFKTLYTDAWKMGCKGLTTFRAAGKRTGILVATDDAPQAEACTIDPATGRRTCDA